jgi:hypothetical protein
VQVVAASCGAVRAALITSFPKDFVDRKILPELRRRGVDVVLVDEAFRAPLLDLEGVEIVLHMTEMGGHTSSAHLSEVCRRAGVPVRSLSRKKSSWSFLPRPA